MYTTCRDCTSRWVGCHDVCDHYKSFRAEQLARYELRKDNSEMQLALSNIKCHAIKSIRHNDVAAFHLRGRVHG